MWFYVMFLDEHALQKQKQKMHINFSNYFLCHILKLLCNFHCLGFSCLIFVIHVPCNNMFHYFEDVLYDKYIIGLYDKYII